MPEHVGWGKVAANEKRDYIGKRSLRVPEHIRSDRLQLVGLTGEPGRDLVIGSHLRLNGSAEATDDWINSAGMRVATRHPIALALLRGGQARVGVEVDVYDEGLLKGRARVVTPPFVDPAGDRMNA